MRKFKLIPQTTLLPQQQEITANIPSPLSDNGPTKGKSKLSDLQEVKDFTTYPTLKLLGGIQKKNAQLSVMQESIPKKKERIYKHRSTSSNQNSQKLKSSPKLRQGWNTIEIGFNIPLKKCLQDLSKELSLPTKTDSVESELNCLNSSFENIMLNSWFSCKKVSSMTQMNQQEMSEICVKDLLEKESEEDENFNNSKEEIENINDSKKEEVENINDPEKENSNDPKEEEIKIPETVLRIKKIRIKISKNLQKIIKQAIDVTRALYNCCVGECCEQKPHWPATSKFLRKKFLNKKTHILEKSFWEACEKVPYAIKDSAIDDFLIAFKTQKKLVKDGKKKFFKMHHRKKKDMLQQSFVLPHRCIIKEDNTISCFQTMWKKEEIKENEPSYEIIETFGDKFPEIINHDCRLVMTKDNKFYLCIPCDIEKKIKEPKNNVVAMDPGSRTFQTTFDDKGISYEIGKADIEKIDKMSKTAQRMRNGIKRVRGPWKKEYKQFDPRIDSFRKAENKKEMKNLQKAAHKLEMKIKNKIKDIQSKSAKFLCETYDTVIIPEFETQNMTQKKDIGGKWKRKIGKDTSRKLIRWGHYNFRKLLKTKGEQLNCNVFVGTEEFTTKTCGNCMFVNDVKDQKEWICENCQIYHDRDINAARNILILNLQKSISGELTPCEISEGTNAVFEIQN